MLDLNMVPGICKPEDWAICGPGAIAGLQKMFGPAVKNNPGAALQWLHEHQEEQFDRLSIHWNDRPRIFPNQRLLSFVDLEHSLCEAEKYSRMAHPHLKVATGKNRTVIKSAYMINETPLTTVLPPAWAKVQRNLKSRHYKSPSAVREGEWEVERIVAEDVAKGKNGETIYLLRWKGWSPHDDTWESLEEMENVDELLQEWNKVKDLIQECITTGGRGLGRKMLI